MHRSFAAGLMAALLASPASADVRALTDFEAVSARDQIRVEISVGPRYSVRVDGGDADRVATRIDRDELRIHQTNRPWFSNRRLDAVVRITMPEVTRISAARGASVRAENVQVVEMTLAAAMGADLRITGSCESVSASAAMGASIDAQGFLCQRADASASMGADVRVAASENLEASASMGGSISVEGTPQLTHNATAMGGSIDIN